MKKQSTAKGFTVLGAASILNKLLSIIYVPFLTYMIGNVGNGIANAGYIVYLLIYQITYMGIPVALSKMVSEQVAVGRYRDSLKTLKLATLMLFGMGAVLGGTMALGAGWIARAVGRPESAMTMLALSPTVLIASCSASFRGYFQGRHNMTPTSVSQIVEQAANTAFTLLFAWWMLRVGQQHAALHGITDPQMVKLYSLQWGAAGSGMGTTAGAVFSAAYLLFFYWRKRGDMRAEAETQERATPARGRSKHKAPSLTGQLARQIIRYAAPITLGAIIVYSASLVDLKFTNQRLEAGGYSDVEAAALFGILTTQYNKIINVPLALANTLAVVMLPGISGTAALNDRQALHAQIDSGLRAVFLVTLPAAAGLAALAEPVIRLLFPGNVAGVDLMRMGSWIIVLMAMVQLQTSILQGMGRMNLPVAHMAVALLVKIAVNYTLIGIPFITLWGVKVGINIRGAIVGSALCFGIAAVWNYMSIRRHAGYHARWRRLLLVPLAAALAMAALAWGVWTGVDALLGLFVASRYLSCAIAIVPAALLGGATYAVLLAALKGVSRGEILRVPVLPRLVGRQRLDRLLDKLRVS